VLFLSLLSGWVFAVSECSKSSLHIIAMAEL